MLRIMIADDEEFIRGGLTEMIHQLDDNYKVVANAANGEEVLAYMKEADVDLVITDIKMPKMDGCELVKALEDDYPATEKIVLSGYDDFQLVRDMFKCGIFDYLVKPINKSQVDSLLRQVDDKIRRRNERKTMEIHEQMRLNESLPLLKEQFLWKLIHSGQISAEQCREKLAYYKVDIGVPPYRVLLTSISNYGALERNIGAENAAIHRYIIQNVVEDSLRENDDCRFASFAKDGTLTTIIGSAPGRPDPDETGITAKLDRNLRQYAKVRFHLIFGHRVSSVTEIKGSCSAAAELLRHAFYEREASVLQEKEPFKAIEAARSADLIESYTFRLLDGIEKGHSQKVRELIREAEGKLRELYGSPEASRALFSELHAKLLAEREAMRALFEDMYGAGQGAYDSAIRDYDTLDELARYAMQIYEDASRRSLTMQAKKEKRWIENAKAYMNEHLQEELTLHRVAEHVFLNPNYFSDLFSKETGETFIDYVTRKRIEKAKALLRESSARTYEVSDLVGYKDATYFSKVFKKIVGMSPSEYRNRAL